MMTDDWLRCAVSDDTLVAELLLRLKQRPPPRLYNWKTDSAAAKSLEWGTRQPRSKSVASKKEADPTAATRRSPTTPLSWSDGYEESSIPSDPYTDGRSKGIGTREATNAAANKRSRRKKTFPELKEEENSLLKEQSYLKRELEALRATLKEHRSVNQWLKRMKIGVHTASGEKLGARFKETVEQSSAASPCIPEASALEDTPKHMIQEDHSLGGWCPRIIQEEAGFVLPDLNMVPEEEDSGREGLVSTI